VDGQSVSLYLKIGIIINILRKKDTDEMLDACLE